MIVLGPHVHTHSKPDNRSFNEETPLPTAETVQESDAGSEIKGTSTIDWDENAINQWDEARLEVSTILGSIGAEPLSPPPRYSSAPPAFINESIIPSYIQATIHLAESHSHLIRTINHALKIISTGTSLRLGLGPTNSRSGNERLVSRAEKAWSERVGSRNIQQYPQLTLQRSRRLLHLAMVDQAVSLRAILPSNQSAVQEYAQWDEFIDDMKYFSRSIPQQTAPVLTLSKLSFWLNCLCGLVSFTMSHLLTGSFMPTDCNATITSLKQSSQFTHERIKFLQSSFKFSKSDELYSDQPSKTPDGQAKGDVESRRHAMKMIHQLQYTLEAAQVSLWAFSQSFTDEQEQFTHAEDENDVVWWSQLKDLLSQTELSVGHFEHRFLSKSEQEDETVSDGDLSVAIDTSNATHHTVLVADIDGISNIDAVPNTQYSLALKEHADKTWVFSGSGIHKKSKPSTRMRNNEPASSEMFGQTMLMRDLQNRLKTMQVAEEHEVVKLDSCKEEHVELNTKSNNTQSTPFFLGAGGSLLTELARAIRSEANHGDLIVDESDFS